MPHGIGNGIIAHTGLTKSTDLHPAEHPGVDHLPHNGPYGGQSEAVEQFQGQV
jgi:hypothetical protein